MLQDVFSKVYSKFKLHFYQKVFENWQEREASLTTVETFCMEIIYAMNKPTVNEFAKFTNISSPNAAYKVNNLIKKGYLKKIQSKEDKREFYLEVTEKYLDYYNISYQYLKTVMDRVEERFSSEELAIMEKILNVMNDELMPEIALPEGKV
ncbi:MAG: MarR family winged helix-turn-helix transcriptional regulator [Lachnospiraceae bacterium]